MKVKKIITPLLALLLVTAYTLTVTSCSEIDEPEYIVKATSSHDMNTNRSRSLISDSILMTDSLMQVPMDSIISDDFIIRDSVEIQSEESKSIAITWYKTPSNDYDCTLKFAGITFNYTAYDTRFFPPQIASPSETNKMVDFDNSGAGGSKYDITYKCTERTDDFCKILITIIDTRNYINLYTKKYYHNYGFVFDCSTTVQAKYWTGESTSKPK